MAQELPLWRARDTEPARNLAVVDYERQDFEVYVGGGFAVRNEHVLVALERERVDVVCDVRGYVGGEGGVGVGV